MIILVLGVGIGFYARERNKQNGADQNQSSSAQNTQNSTTSDSQPNGSNIPSPGHYQNTPYGFELTYPTTVANAPQLQTDFANLTGTTAPNSEMGTVQTPVSGIYIGPYVFVVANTPELKSKLDFYNFGRAEKIDNSDADIRFESINGPSGPAQYAEIKAKNGLVIFVDGYSGGFGTQLQSGPPGRKDPNILKNILKSFKLTQQ